MHPDNIFLFFLQLEALLHPPGGVPCLSDPDGRVSEPRDNQYALSIVVLSLCASVLEGAWTFVVDLRHAL